MKKLLLILTMMLPLVANAETVEINGIWYNIIIKGSFAEVTQNPSGDYYSGVVSIPEKVIYQDAEYIVTSIKDNAFYSCYEMTSVSIPNSVTSIGENAFWGCTSLKSIIIPSGVTSISKRAFGGCSGLSSIAIPSSITSINEGAFYGCSNLLSFIFPTNIHLKSIEKETFAGCSNLSSIIIPDGVTNIDEKAFADCYSLKSISIPNSVTSIFSHAFLNCTGITSVTIPNSVTYLSGFSSCTGLTSVNIPNNVTTIGFCAFSGCTGITSIIIPSSVTTIEESAFSGAGLTSITIPNSITSIGNSAFRGCTNLTSVNMLNGITSINSSAFWGCSGLTNIIFPPSLSYIGEYAFTNCSNVGYVQFFSIEQWLNLRLDNLFQNAQFNLDKVNIKNLTTLNIPEGVTYIREEAFKGFNKLTSIIFPSSITSISYEAFYGCDNLTDIYCLSENVPLADYNAFKDSYIEYTTLHVPAVSLDKYKNCEPWSQFGKILTLNGEDIPETPETPKCATPIISFKDGKISFSCDTEGVEFISEITSPTMIKKYDQEISLSSAYTVTVYATKSGYDNSEKASIEIQANSGIKGDLTGDGKVDVADHVELSKIIMSQKENVDN